MVNIMRSIRRWGWVSLLMLLAACGGKSAAPTEPPTTPTPFIVTLEPTRDPLLQSEGIVIEEFGAVSGEIRPRLRIDQNGDLHVMWLDVDETGNRELRYRRWDAELGWHKIETWQTWSGGDGPIDWELMVDDLNNPLAIWSEKGKLVFLRYVGPGEVLYFDLPFDVGGDINSPNYNTSFGAVLSGGEIFVVYRDTNAPTANLRLGYSPYSGKDWQPLAVVMPDPGAPTLPIDIGMAAGSDGTIHMIVDSSGGQIYVHRVPDENENETEAWRGQASGQDVFDVGTLGRDIVTDSLDRPHFLFEENGTVHYRYWNGAAWDGPSQPLLSTRDSKHTMAFALAPDDLAWVLGDGMADEFAYGMPKGLWLRTYSAQYASDPWLLRRGSMSECAIAISSDQAHIITVIDGTMYHIRMHPTIGSALPRQLLEDAQSPDAEAETGD